MRVTLHFYHWLVSKYKAHGTTGRMASVKMTAMVAWFDWVGLGIGAGGLIASIAGLIFAFLARRAARSAEAAAERASEETRRTVSRSRRTVETGRAIALMNRLKVLHRDRRWDYALELYQELRSTLNDIHASMPDDLAEIRDSISGGVHEVTKLEADVNRARYENREPDDVPGLDGVLSDIQRNLERLQSTDIYGQ